MSDGKGDDPARVREVARAGSRRHLLLQSREGVGGASGGPGAPRYRLADARNGRVVAGEGYALTLDEALARILAGGHDRQEEAGG